jgi:hypothetical protein
LYPIQYRTVAADADIGDKTGSLGRYVDATDCAGMSIFGMAMPTPFCSGLYRIAGIEDLLYALFSGGFFFSPQSVGFDLNDMVVTQNSARSPRFPPAISPIVPNPLPWVRMFDPLRKNHSTVGDSCVAGGGVAPCTTGMGVLGAIQAIQPIQ